jgi:membrane protein implicated in regulation of membrane protease activity
LIPAWVFWGSIIFWVVKDVVLFRFTWRAYDWNGGDKKVPIGAQGIAKDRLAPIGYVKVGNELWRAEVAGDSPPIESGMNVRVKAVRGFTLLVELDSE